MTRFVTMAPPISNIDSKCHRKAGRTYLIGYSGFISREWFLIAHTRTRTRFHELTRRAPGLKINYNEG